ncbi:ATP-binding cassette domain-containing protein [Microbacterium karelineae]|uniref:ATP-binding cassette domain-containing protein n=1 Tax=Microbacterium karelineae TaxID=2654283 RepID=UPI0012EAD43F|nr:ATP-binding cassette domain-containing protein [Microbacterium karelineae]
MNAPLLEVDDLAVTYDGPIGLFRSRRPEPAIEHMTFDVAAGETLGIVGESGSGKSTTGRAILRLETVTHGAIRFEGQDLSTWGPRTPLSYRRRVQAVFQDPSVSLNPRHLVSHGVQQALRRHGVTDRAEVADRTRRAFELVGLTADHMNRFPNELSGGQQQRVAIARAIVLEPSLIVCDEAVSALDLSTQGQIINLLEDLQSETGVSYLFIAHDLSVVRHIADRVGVMRAGRLVELAETEALYEDPQDPYTRSLLAATPASHPSGRDERRAIRLAGRAEAT